MNIIFVNKNSKRAGALRIGRAHILVVALLVLGIIPGAFLAGGYWAGFKSGVDSPDLLMSAWKQQMQQQRQELSDVNRSTRENMDALAMRLGQLQAHVIRLDALGSRLTKIAKLDKGEFDFSTSPAQGGPAAAGGGEPLAVDDFIVSLEGLSHQLDDRAQQLELLESMFMTRNLQGEVYPAGRPTAVGWESSYYGMRTDPFTGHREQHKGVDFAGKEGSEVLSVAAGVVTWAGDRSGYGNLIEVNHGNGYSTRYGHNRDILVKVGDTVKKGQPLGLMGSTGRSTGPHVHFEVLLNGHQVDPTKYVQAGL